MTDQTSQQAAVSDDEIEAALFAAYVAKQFHHDPPPVRCTSCLPHICWEDEAVSKHWLTWKAARAQHAQQAKTDKEVSEQVARFAIDGAIAYGRLGINPPPSDDHWLTEYWRLGRQQAEHAQQAVVSERDRALEEAHQIVFDRAEKLIQLQTEAWQNRQYGMYNTIASVISELDGLRASIRATMLSTAPTPPAAPREPT